jgi:zinc protease
MSAVGDSIGEIVRFGLNDDYFNTYSQRVRALGLSDVNNAAQKVVHPGNLAWVVVGDREKIEPGIRELNVGTVSVIDADGNVKPGK